MRMVSFVFLKGRLAYVRSRRARRNRRGCDRWNAQGFGCAGVVDRHSRLHIGWHQGKFRRRQGCVDVSLTTAQPTSGSCFGVL
jgi:hypothetical protein